MKPSPPVAPDDTPRWLPLIQLENGSHVGLDVVMERWADLLQGDAPDLARIAKDIDDVAGHLWLKDSLAPAAPDDTPPEWEDCPHCSPEWVYPYCPYCGKPKAVAPDDTPTRLQKDIKEYRAALLADGHLGVVGLIDELRAEVSRLREQLNAKTVSHTRLDIEYAERGIALRVAEAEVSHLQQRIKELEDGQG